jgi:predicted metal-dependent hydrolase
MNKKVYVMNLVINEGADIIEFEVTYSKRKTMSIKITPDGDIKVAAPANMSRKAVIDWVKSKSNWIVKNITEIEKIKYEIVSKEFVNENRLLYLGIEYSLHLDIDQKLKKPLVNLYEDSLMVSTPTDDREVIKTAMESWYRYMADKHIRSRIEYYQPIIGVSPNKVKIKEQKSRWGSCSSKGNLNFNWKVIMAPADVLDYIIVHEMCHLIHLNHSKDYWKQVSSIMPNYKVLKNWLRKNGIKLRLY